MKMSVPTGGTPSTWPKDRSFRPWSSAVEASSTLAHADALASKGSKGAFSALSTSSCLGGGGFGRRCKGRRIRLGPDGESFHPVVGIGSVFASTIINRQLEILERHQVPGKHKTVLRLNSGNWAVRRGQMYRGVPIAKVCHAPITREDRHPSSLAATAPVMLW